MPDVHVKLNPELAWQNSNQQKEESFHHQVEIKLVICYILA
jgi:hypothetical protein